MNSLGTVIEYEGDDELIKVNGKEIEFVKFPNEETNMKHLSFPDVSNQSHSTVCFKYENDSDLIKLLFVKNHLDTLVGEEHEIYLEIYYMPYSRMDRSVDGSPYTLKWVSNFINNMKFNSILIVEPHSDKTTDLLHNSHSFFINKVLYRIVLREIDFDTRLDYIMFPDKGAATRYKDFLFPNVLIGEKTRNFETGRIESLNVTGKVGDITNKVLIIDDLSSYGGTFCTSAKKLREIGFEEIYLLVAHSENNVFKGELFNNIDKLFTTDSILTEQDLLQNKKFESQLRVYKMEEFL